MYKPGKRVISAVLVLGAILGALGIWVLLHPASVFVQPWRAVRAESPVAGVIVGPYPVEADFIELKKRGVTTIISLLEPVVPYEKVLLDEERERARRYGMEVKNFPMGSILGQKFGEGYSANSRAAADAAINAKGVAYIHCYLGVHRAVNVQKYLADYAKARTETYVGTNAVSGGGDLAAERDAMDAFHANDYEKSVAIISGVTRKTPRLLLLEAWTYYRLNRIVEARATFNRVLALDPGDADAQLGLGYCDLRENRVDAAATAFTAVMSSTPDQASASAGMGHVRFRQGRFTEAKAQFARALELDPGNGEVRQMIDRITTFQANGAGDAVPAGTGAP